jgi:hypothetical protein
VRALLLGAALAIAAGCAKDATAVVVTVDADATAPPILILRTTVARVDDPSTRSSSSRASTYAGDAADRPGPFLFPFDLSLTVDPIYVGEVVITVDGIDWDTQAVTASGSTSAVVAAQKMTAASVTLAPIRTGGPDAGTD